MTSPFCLNMFYRVFFGLHFKVAGGGGGSNECMLLPIQLCWLLSTRNGCFLIQHIWVGESWRGPFLKSLCPPPGSADFWPHWTACSWNRAWGSPQHWWCRVHWRSDTSQGWNDIYFHEMSSTFIHHLWIVFSLGSVFPRAFRTMQ